MHPCNCFNEKLDIHVSMQTHSLPSSSCPLGTLLTHVLWQTTSWSGSLAEYMDDVVLDSFHAGTPLSFTPLGVPWLSLQDACASTPESFEEYSFFAQVFLCAILIHDGFFFVYSLDCVSDSLKPFYI